MLKLTDDFKFSYQLKKKKYILICKSTNIKFVIRVFIG